MTRAGWTPENPPLFRQYSLFAALDNDSFEDRRACLLADTAAAAFVLIDDRTGNTPPLLDADCKERTVFLAHHAVLLVVPGNAILL
jgi:hypothetical protein